MNIYRFFPKSLKAENCYFYFYQTIKDIDFRLFFNVYLHRQKRLREFRWKIRDSLEIKNTNVPNFENNRFSTFWCLSGSAQREESEYGTFELLRPKEGAEKRSRMGLNDQKNYQNKKFISRLLLLVEILDLEGVIELIHSYNFYLDIFFLQGQTKGQLRSTFNFQRRALKQYAKRPCKDQQHLLRRFFS